MGFGIDDLKVFFVYLSYLSPKTHCHNYLSVKNTNRTLVAEETYYGLICPRAE